METDDLSKYLESLEREDGYRVDRVLNRSDAEVTERVFARGADGGEHGPYIRKRIARGSGMGEAYERIWQANREGRRFAHIPFVRDFHRTENDTVVVMEHVNGQTLADVVYERDPGVKLACEMFPALCDAVSELHESFNPPIIHRDLKPGNVMVRNGIPVLIDFGIAREYRDAADADTTNLGTRAYAPPEQFGYEQTTVRSDVYTLGLLLYYLLVEQTPSPKVLRRGFQDARIPEELRRVIAYATAFDPKERYGSAAELKFAFLDALAHCAPVTATMAPSVEQPPMADATPNRAVATPETAAVPAPVPAAAAVPVPAQAPTREAQAPYGEPATASPHPAPPSYATPMPNPNKGRLRNIAVLVVYALLVVFSWRDAVDPSLVENAYPAPYHQYMYIICVPIFMGIFAYAALDKTRLKRRFAAIPWPTGGRTIGMGILIFVVLMALTCITGSMAGIY